MDQFETVYRMNENTKLTLTVGQLKRLVREAVQKRPVRRTKPFFLHHAVLLPTPVRTFPPDAYGRRIEKIYDKILVYNSPTTYPYYIWTQYKHGPEVLNRIQSLYMGKWVTAKLMFDGKGTNDRISPVGIQVVQGPPQAVQTPQMTPQQVLTAQMAMQQRGAAAQQAQAVARQMQFNF